MKQIRKGHVLVLMLLAAGTSALADSNAVPVRSDALLTADADANGHLSADEWSALFTTLDANGDGELAPDEFLPGPHRRFSASPPDELLAHLIARGADEDGDGVVTKWEWATRLQAIDKNGDVALEIDELPSPPQVRNDERLAELIGRWDANQDGKLGAAELSTLFEKADRDQDGELSPSDGWQWPPAP